MLNSGYLLSMSFVVFANVFFSTEKLVNINNHVMILFPIHYHSFFSESDFFSSSLRLFQQICVREMMNVRLESCGYNVVFCMLRCFSTICEFLTDKSNKTLDWMWTCIVHQKWERKYTHTQKQRDSEYVINAIDLCMTFIREGIRVFRYKKQLQTMVFMKFLVFMGFGTVKVILRWIFWNRRIAFINTLSRFEILSHALPQVNLPRSFLRLPFFDLRKFKLLISFDNKSSKRAAIRRQGSTKIKWNSGTVHFKLCCNYHENNGSKKNEQLRIRILITCFQVNSSFSLILNFVLSPVDTLTESLSTHSVPSPFFSLSLFFRTVRSSKLAVESEKLIVTILLLILPFNSSYFCSLVKGSGWSWTDCH